jgi:hypothetical protein
MIISPVLRPEDSRCREMMSDTISHAATMVGKVALNTLASGVQFALRHPAFTACALGAALIPGAHAGAIAYSLCVALCEAGAASATVATAGAATPAMVACLKGCLPLLALPFPP